ncbi:MAG: D-2-hydroxyacid dehydrogenase [Planctomycetes bacterium]|nr:D-2-hydroxyacid dehydrogenase [Planctomycetota bacterium]
MPQILAVIPLEEAARHRLEELPGVSVRSLSPGHPRERVAREWDLPPDLLRGTEILLCKFPPRNLFDMVDLKMMQLATVGYEHLRDRGFADRPLRVCNARGIFDSSIAEWCLAMMVNLARDLRVMIRNQERAHWERRDRFEQEVRGGVVGLWGYGGIGRETARLAKAFGMTVHVLTRSPVGPRRDAYTPACTGDPEGVLPDRTFTTAEELDFLAGLDFLVLALPHTKASNGMVGERELRALPSRAFLLNPSRGPIVQEQALLRALREGWIAGAALDTHFVYPLPPEHPLWSLPNVILTPHISGADHSRHFPGRIGDLFAQNVERYLASRPLLNEVTAAEWREAEMMNDE